MRRGDLRRNLFTGAIVVCCLAAVARGAPITGKYGLTGRSVRIDDGDRSVSRLESTATVRRKFVRITMKGTDESNETFRCGWTVRFMPLLRNTGKRQKRTGRLGRVPCDSSRWDAEAVVTSKKRAGTRHLTVRISARAVAGRDTDATARISLAGERDS